MGKKNILLRRYIAMVLGVLIISIGIALLKESHLGNDPMSAFSMRLSEIFGIPLGTQNLIFNALFLLLQFSFGKKYIGAGTFVNGIILGYIVSFFYAIFVRHFGYAETQGLGVQLLWAAAAVVITSLGVSLVLPLMIICLWDFVTKRRNRTLPVGCLRTELVRLPLS